MLKSNHDSVAKLLAEIQQALTDDSAKLPSLLTMAIRLAALTDNPEYRFLFEIHQAGITQDGSKPAITAWPDQSRQQRWNPVTTCFEDRKIEGGKMQGLSADKLEYALAEIVHARVKKRTDSGLVEQELAYRDLINRIRHRISLFANEIEASMTSPALLANSPNNRGVFIGHGRSAVWRHLSDFLWERLRLRVVEFNREPTAGMPTSARLEEMLSDSEIAFLVLTAEDPRGDGRMHARDNVIHEAGLFQGRLGFHRAILLLEDGCEEFSNIVGLGQIRFPKGRIDAAFEEVRRVLEREGLL